MSRFVASIVAVCAFVVSCGIISRLLPIAPVHAVQPKLLHLSQYVQQYDTIFLGSSRIYHQIDPTQFDRLMADRGNPTHSFNAGVDGMRPPEDAYLLDQILDLKPQRLRYVFLELGALKLPVDEDKRGTNRSVYWHDWKRMEILFQRMIAQKPQKKWRNRVRDYREAAADFAEHAGLFLRNAANVGRGDFIMRYLRSYEPRRIGWEALGKRKDGFTIVTPAGVLPENLRVQYERAMRSRQKEPAVQDLDDAVSQRALALMIDRVRSLGAEPVLIVPPTTTKKKFVPGPELATRALVFDYADLSKYPELFALHNRQDTDHLNEPGAALFTEILVNEFSAAVERQK